MVFVMAERVTNKNAVYIFLTATCVFVKIRKKNILS